MQSTQNAHDSALNFWHKQGSQPLFPDLLWSRPETRTQAGKLLIIGGHAQGFADTAKSYNAATQAGAGSVRVLLPDALPRSIKAALQTADFAPSTPSGSFARRALDEWLHQAAWADAVLLPGDLGRNSETAIVLESFLQKTAQPTILSGDALDYLLATPAPNLKPNGITVVATQNQLQKLATAAKLTTAITSSTDLLTLVKALHNLTTQHPISIVAEHQNSLVVAHGGQISTTKIDATIGPELAAKAAVWQMQNPNNIFAALTTSLINPTMQ